MNRPTTALGALALIMTNTGCAVVLDPVEQDTAPEAIAILAKDMPAPPDSPGWSGNWTPDWAASDPDGLVLMWSNAPQLCASPDLGPPCADQTVWQGTLLLPSDLVRVGPVDLSNPRIMAFANQLVDSACSGGGGGGTAPGGTMEITSIDATSITVNLVDGIEGALPVTVNGVTHPSVNIQGTFEIPRCDAAPSPPPPAAAVAIRGADLPAGLPSSPTIGASPDPTALYVFLGNGTQTCDDPMSPLACDDLDDCQSPLGCSGGARLALRIPAELQQPGTLDLTDPRLAPSVELSLPASDMTSSCASSVVSSFAQGKLTITSVDATGVTFSLFQSLAASPGGGQYDADGLYQATICP